MSNPLIALWSWLTKRGPEPWMPACPEAQIEMRRARSITWSYDKFRYHLDRAFELEEQYRFGRRSGVDAILKEPEA